MVDSSRKTANQRPLLPAQQERVALETRPFVYSFNRRFGKKMIKPGEYYDQDLKLSLFGATPFLARSAPDRNLFTQLFFLFTSQRAKF
jgi:hypothetical protein